MILQEFGRVMQTVYKANAQHKNYNDSDNKYEDRIYENGMQSK